MIEVKTRQEMINFYEDCYKTETIPAIKIAIKNEIEKIKNIPDDKIDDAIEQFNQTMQLAEDLIDNAVQELFGKPEGVTLQ